MDDHKAIISGKHDSILLPVKMDDIIIPAFKQMEKRLLTLCLTISTYGKNQEPKERKKPNKC